jgi:pimeloyl-ACP methyl ester carboxylesterase
VYNIPSKTLYKFNEDDNGGSIAEKIKTIETPTLIIWGDKDQLTDVEDAKKFNEELVNSQLIVIKDTGHIQYIEKQEIFLKVIFEFINMKEAF